MWRKLSIVSLFFVLMQSAYAGPFQAVADTAFIDMHTGPGRGYPKFYVIEKGQQFTVLKQRTSWIKVVTQKEKIGWIRSHDLEHSTLPDGRKILLSRFSLPFGE